MKVPELLAPVGSFEALDVAINAGADAVYLGGKRFGARHYAANFDLGELEEAVRKAHFREVKVYVTVNTLVSDFEIPDALEYLVQLYEMGVDAVLVQDLGLAVLARELVPKLELHASTQMTIHNLEGAIWAANMGFERVVLAREMALDEVEKIARDAPIGVEIFVHGALCYCYSGQCLLSSLIGGRSGNRGMCAQPCRKPYDLVLGWVDSYGRILRWKRVSLDEKYLMSTKDLAIYPYLDEVVASGVEALKIEGRMRSSDYAAVVVSVYRRALDKIAQGEWSPSEEDWMKLALTFNRDFTRGYLLGDRGRDLMGRDQPDNRGVLVGTVVSYDSRRREAAVQLEGDLVPGQGDGLVFIWPGGEVGFVLRDVPNVRDGIIRLGVYEMVERGAKVHLTRRAGLLAGTVSGTRHIPLDLKMSLDEEMKPVLEGGVPCLKGDVTVTVTSSFSMEVAKRRPLSREDIEVQLGKMGRTVFCVRSLEVDYPGGLFAPLGELNRLRRDLLEAVEARLVESSRPSFEDVNDVNERLKIFAREWKNPSTQPLPKLGLEDVSISVYTSDLDGVKGAVGGRCARVYFEPFIRLDDPHEAIETIKKAMRLCERYNVEFAWKWPKITRRSFLDTAIFILEETETKVVMVDNIGAAKTIKENVPHVKVLGSSGLNVWNHRSTRFLGEIFERITISPELSSKEIEELARRVHLLEKHPELEMIVQGDLEAMVTENDLISTALKDQSDLSTEGKIWGLKDSTQRIFPLVTDGEDRTHVFNAVETCLFDHVPDVLKMGICSLSIDARWRPGQYARAMTKVYKEVLELAILEEDPERLFDLKKRVRKMSRGGITAGAFVRGRKEPLP